MAKFLSGNELNAEIGKIFKEANAELVLVSPFIKLHHRFRDEINSKKENDKLKITIVFGKNEDDLSKSISIEEIEFFKQFPNIEIRYEKRLHAKYYANERSAILSSMNLYSYSQDNNIEAGILTTTSFIDQFAIKDTIDQQAANYFQDTVIPNSDLLFKKEPQYDSTNFGLSKKYSSSLIKFDNLNAFFSKSSIPTLSVPIKKQVQINSERKGYCIRTGKEIPLNPQKPFSMEAFKKWNEYKDEKYKEKFCHFSGEASEGETSFAKPILKKNWHKAKDWVNN